MLCRGETLQEAGSARPVCMGGSSRGSSQTEMPLDPPSKGLHNSQVSIVALPNMELQVTLRPFWGATQRELGWHVGLMSASELMARSLPC